eukprot:g27173.t1
MFSTIRDSSDTEAVREHMQPDLDNIQAWADKCVVKFEDIILKQWLTSAIVQSNPLTKDELVLHFQETVLERLVDRMMERRAVHFLVIAKGNHTNKTGLD